MEMLPQDSNASFVDVPLGERGYRVEIASGAVDRFAQSITATISDLTHAIMITDQAVDAPWATPLAQSLESFSGPESIRVSKATVASGEAFADAAAGTKSLSES